MTEILHEEKKVTHAMVLRENKVIDRLTYLAARNAMEHVIVYTDITRISRNGNRLKISQIELSRRHRKLTTHYRTKKKLKKPIYISKPTANIRTVSLDLRHGNFTTLAINKGEKKKYNSKTIRTNDFNLIFNLGEVQNLDILLGKINKILGVSGTKLNDIILRWYLKINKIETPKKICLNTFYGNTKLLQKKKLKVHGMSLYNYFLSEHTITKDELNTFARYPYNINEMLAWYILLNQDMKLFNSLMVNIEGNNTGILSLPNSTDSGKAIISDKLKIDFSEIIATYGDGVTVFDLLGRGRKEYPKSLNILFSMIKTFNSVDDYFNIPGVVTIKFSEVGKLMNELTYIMSDDFVMNNTILNISKIKTKVISLSLNNEPLIIKPAYMLNSFNGRMCGDTLFGGSFFYGRLTKNTIRLILEWGNKFYYMQYNIGQIASVTHMLDLKNKTYIYPPTKVFEALKQPIEKLESEWHKIKPEVIISSDKLELIKF